MKALTVLLLVLSSMSAKAIDLRCDYVDGLMAGYAHTELSCSGGGKSYDVTIRGISLGIRGTEGKAKFNIRCPFQKDPRGHYSGLRFGAGFIVSGEVAVFANPLQGICGVGGVSEGNGLTLLEASILTIE